MYDPEKVFVSGSELETQKFAETLAKSLAGGDLVALHGDLGAGKTVFTRGIAKGLGIEEPICSPTFTVVQEYECGGLRLYHIDLYRLQGTDDALAFGIEDYLEDEHAITVIEWSERIDDLLKGLKTWHIYIEHMKTGRNIRVFQC